MNRTLHEADNAQRILKLTADTMLLVDRNGICIDIDIHSNLWFLQEERLLGKNIFERMPEHTREKVYSTFQTVLREQRSISKNYKLELEDNTYYFKCIMYPYDDMVLCQYRDITQRSNVKRQLEQVNRNLREIQKVAQIGQWMYNTRDNVFHYMGYTGVLCEESSRSISLEKYQEFIVEEDRMSFTNWCRKMRKDSTKIASAIGSVSPERFTICAFRLICETNYRTAAATSKVTSRTSLTYSVAETTSTR